MDRRVAKTNTSQHRMCRICHHEAKLVHIYGGLSCRACVAFFLRAVKRDGEYECKRNELACGEEAVLNFSANHACRRCRFDRCLREGMKVEYVKSAKRPFLETMILNLAGVDETLPLLYGTVQAMAQVNLYRSQSYNPDSTVIHGTSESGPNFLTGVEYRVTILSAASLFRQMFNFLPLVCELNFDAKETMFKNTLGYYFILTHSLCNAHCLMAGSSADRYFLFPDKYVDLDEAKLEGFYRTYRSSGYDPSKASDYRVVSRACSKFFLLQRNLLSFAAKEYFLTDEDFAAFILLMIIHTNKSNTSENCQQTIDRLKSVWKELDSHYRATNRDPSKWGNLMFFLANVQSISVDFLELMNVVEVYIGGNVYLKVVEDNLESCSLD